MASSLYSYFHYAFLSSSLIAFFFLHLSHGAAAAPVFLHLSHGAAAAPVAILPKGSSGIHLPIRKSNTSLQYYTTLEMGDRDPSELNVIRNTVNVVIDLGGPLLWFDCEQYISTSYRPIHCESRKCKAAKGFGCISCTLPGPPRPGCTNDTCIVDGYNSFSNKLYVQGLGEDVVEVYSTDGRSIISSNYAPHFHLSCAADSSLVEGLASGTKGMVGLGMTPTSLLAQIAAAFKLPHPRTFALCIPSSSKSDSGDIFIGGGPYYMLPYTKDLSKSLASTPLLVNPVSTAVIYTVGDPSYEYFIDVKFIKVGGIRLGSFNSSLLAIDKEGVGGTKLSTLTPFTVLHSSIYKALFNKFVKVAASKKIKRVTSVAPFGACFRSKTIDNAITGPDVPSIDLVLQNGVYWRIFGVNSMVKVTKNILCLGFVDGGSKPRTSVVLGGHQLENVVLEFDLATSTLGFSSSLLVHNTSCSHNRIFF